jgi:hypothetical protein
MKKHLVLLFALTTFCAHATPQHKDAAMQALSALTKGNIPITKIEIFQFSLNSSTLIPVSKDVLENHYSYKFTIQYEGVNRYLPSLIESLKETKIKPSNANSDLRWGVIFFGLNERRITSVYIDYFGMAGYIDSTAVNFVESEQKGVLKWIKNNFSNIFKIDNSMYPVSAQDRRVSNTQEDVDK